jgi:hypothetical protein
VAAQDELRDPVLPGSGLALGQMRQADALLELGHQRLVVIPDVASQFPLVVVLHRKAPWGRTKEFSSVTG